MKNLWIGDAEARRCLQQRNRRYNENAGGDMTEERQELVQLAAVCIAAAECFDAMYYDIYLDYLLAKADVHVDNPRTCPSRTVPRLEK